MIKLLIFDATPGATGSTGSPGHNLDLMVDKTFCSPVSKESLSELILRCKDPNIDALLLHTTDLKSVLGNDAESNLAKLLVDSLTGVSIIFFSGGGAPEDFRSALLKKQYKGHIETYSANELRKNLKEYYSTGDPGVFISSTSEIAIRLLNSFMLFSWFLEIYQDKKTAARLLLKSNSTQKFENNLSLLIAAICFENDIAGATKGLIDNHKDWLVRLGMKCNCNAQNDSLDSYNIISCITKLCSSTTSLDLNCELISLRNSLLSIKCPSL